MHDSFPLSELDLGSHSIVLVNYGQDFKEFIRMADLKNLYKYSSGCGVLAWVGHIQAGILLLNFNQDQLRSNVSMIKLGQSMFWDYML